MDRPPTVTSSGEDTAPRPPTILVEPSSPSSGSPRPSFSSPPSEPTPLPEENQVNAPQRDPNLLDELKYLLKSTNSLANPDSILQASQETDVAIKRRTLQFEDEVMNESERLLLAGLSAAEVRSLGAADRRSIASRGQRTSYIDAPIDRSRSPSIRSSTHGRSYSQPAPIRLSNPSSQPSLLDRIPELMWIFFAAYAFSVIAFLTNTYGVDLIFGFFLQTLVQTAAFGVYVFYKGYHLVGPAEHRSTMFAYACLIGLSALSAFLAYYYLTLPDLSAVRQSQLIVTLIFCMFFLREHVTMPRIAALILTIVAIIVLLRPTNFAASLSNPSNSTHPRTTWVPYSSSWNHIIGIGLALCSALLHSIASTIHKAHLTAEHIHDTVIGFWSAVFTLLMSSVLLAVTHFVISDARTFPHDWRLYIACGLALLSIFAYIARHKANRRERSSVVTLVYATDIILALFLQNVFTRVKSDVVTLLGCILMLTATIVICVEGLLVARSQQTSSAKIAEIANADSPHDVEPKPSILKTSPKRLSV